MSDFRFASPHILNLLWFVPIYVLLGFYYAKKREQRFQQLMGERVYPFLSSSVSYQKRKWKTLLEALTIACLILALARPQTGASTQKIKSEGVELMFVVDVSQSMMAEDIKPSRLDLAKRELTRFLELGGGDKVGIVAFAGSAALLSPVTTDKSALMMYLDSLTPDSVSTQGTNFKEALQQAQAAFERGGIEKDETTTVARAIIIASDGEDNEEGAVTKAKELEQSGIRIFSLAFGTEKGAPIPIRDRRGHLVGYRKDDNGQVILTKTKGTILQELANVGGGSFYHVTFGGSSMNQLREDLNRLEKATFESAELVSYEEKFQLFLLLGLFFGLFDLYLGDRKHMGRLWKGRFEIAQD